MIIGFLDTVHPILENRLKAAGFTCLPMYTHDREMLKKDLPGLNGLVVRARLTLDQDILQHAAQLKFIARSGAGMENIDTGYCLQKNIVCFNSPEGNRDAVGERVIGMLLMLFNNLKRADAEVRQGIWKREENRGLEIAGKTVGIIGYGNMGSALAKKLRGFDCTVLAHDKYKQHFSDEYVKEVPLADIQKNADVISLHLPQTTETTHYINKTFIDGCAKPFYLVNTARGKNVSTADLVDALESGKIKGACLDVLEYEKSSFENLDIKTLPAPMQYLVKSNKVILAPHIAGWTVESYEKLSSFLADKILAQFS